ncbi:metallopeptidase family protein [Candidatus Parcubacteria bacterium]|nr:metallopeptidase family protein [Candidatus Parcubacteria bacterium]
MLEKDFEKLVKEAMKKLPKHIQEKMDNVAIVVKKKPSSYELEKTGIKIGGTLLGLYQGVPKTAWGRGFGMILPDKITIFQGSIEQIASSQEEIKELVTIVVWHEIAHHFGFNETQIRKLETKWRKR